MIKEKINIFLNKIKDKNELDNKKKIENLVVFLIILIITILAINMIWKDKKIINKSTDNKELAIEVDQNKIVESNENDLEAKLENILSKIDGVKDVDVLITYSESTEVVFAYNENRKNSSTQETDSNGGTRTINESDLDKEIVYKDENGQSVPITQKIVNPKIEGAVIIATGANNMNVKTCIIQAVETATGLATHKIQVFERGIN